MRTWQIVLLLLAILAILWRVRKWRRCCTPKPPRFGSPGWEWAGVDPLVASWAHNRLHGILYRLPPEVIHMVVRRLYDEDFAALLSLRLVSSPVYHHITGYLSAEVGRNMFGASVLELEVNESTKRRFDKSARRKYETYLCKDRFCARCLAAMYSRAVVEVDCERLKYSMRRYCRVDACDDVLRCAGCKYTQPWSSFSLRQQYAPPPSGPVCIGREKSFRLCPHRQVWWREIENNFGAWSSMSRVNGSGKGHGDNRIMTVLCCKGGCGRRCGFSEARGAVELKCYATPSAGKFVLRLEWTVHELMGCCADGRLGASGFRAMFREHRELMPWLRVLPEKGSPDPEMACFFPEGRPCGCIRYVDGGVGDEWLEGEWMRRWSRGGCPPAYNSCRHQAKLAKTLDVSVSICRGKLSPDNDTRSGQRRPDLTAEQMGENNRRRRQRCVITTYTRNFVFRQLGASRGLFNPFHEWQHLLPQSSAVAPWMMEPGSWPACEDPTCAHYLGLALCPAWRRDVRWGSGRFGC